jgi:hypothetical protein
VTPAPAVTNPIRHAIRALLSFGSAPISVVGSSLALPLAEAKKAQELLGKGGVSVKFGLVCNEQPLVS